MKRKLWKSCLSMAMAATLVAGSVSLAVPVNVFATESDAVSDDTTSGNTVTETIYYIDAENGNDANAGTSTDAAWASFANLKDLELDAGDKVLLKAGCTWNNEKLEITGAKGTEEAPVVLGKYGEGENPIINGNGNPWLKTTTAPKEDVAVVHVKDSEYIIIQDLEVTNWEYDSADLMGELNNDEGIIYDQSKSLLTGILVENEDAGELKGVVIKNNYVHNVNGYMSKNGSEGHKKGSGGIMVLVTGGEVESYFTDLQIIGNKVEQVCHEAIYMESCWAARELVGGAGSQQAGSYKWVGWPNVYVAHNYVNDVAGDGIVLINADGGVAEYNLVTASARETWNASRNPAHAAIWMWDCNNVTMQYNEAAYTESTQDGMAFDCDYGNQNVMYQYNYSHDNKGGFWMACPGPYFTVNSVVRYNVSVNDGNDGTRIIRVGEQGGIGHQVYNNTMYWDHGKDVNAVEQGSWGTAPSGGTDIYNNIFCGDSDTFVDNDGIHYDSNCVWGSVKDIYPAYEDINAIIADPMFVDVEAYTKGSFEDGQVTLGTVDGFKLQANSLCIDNGAEFMEVPNATDEAVEDELVETHITIEGKDYAGNAVPYVTEDGTSTKIDIGAFEYQGKAEQKVSFETDKVYLTALAKMASAYEQPAFSSNTWSDFAKALSNAQKVLTKETAAQQIVDACAGKLEDTMVSLERAGAVREGTPADDILKESNSDSDVDNNGFEKSKANWGYWQSSVSVSDEQAHTGSQSFKVVQTTSGTTGYSELGGVPVEANTSYVLEAWIYVGDEDASQLGLEAKHHHNITGSSDIKVGTMTLSDTAENENGWYKATMEFTTDAYEVLSVSISSNISVTYLDDVVLYPKTVDTVTSVDRTGIEEALKLMPKEEEAYYTPGSFKAYQDAVLAARLARADAYATDASLKAAESALENAYKALAKVPSKSVLKALYNAYSKTQKGAYTDSSWNAFIAALNHAKAVLEDVNSVQADVDKAVAELKAASSKLSTVKAAQEIKYTDTYEVTYGAKAFKVDAALTKGNGALSYVSSDVKVATVTNTGVVTIKGTGACVITVTAAATGDYNAKSVAITIKVAPKKVTVKSAKAVGGKKMTITWKKDSKATGYEVQYCLKKNFKSAVKKVTVKKASKVSTTVKKLKQGKKYYVRVRAYKTAKVNGKTVKIYGAWSKVKTSKKIK